MTTPLPPYGPAMRRLHYLLSLSDVADRLQWATDLLGRPVSSLRQLTGQDVEWLIAWLVLEESTPRLCRATLGGRHCLHSWPGHPLLCTDIDGTEWLAREI